MEFETFIFVFLLLLAITLPVYLHFKPIVLSKTKATTSNKTEASIAEACFELSRTRRGALIILDNRHLIASSLSHRTKLEADVSKDLICTIFQPHTPLHDGAILISGDKISYARCYLPLTANHPSENETFGTRHLVANETSLKYKTTCIVVSEETGQVRIMKNGDITLVQTKEELVDLIAKK